MQFWIFHKFNFTNFIYIKNKFSLERLQLCYTDTDSLIYKIFSENVYLELKDDIHHTWFDTSDYPKDNRFGYPQVNKKIMKMLKDELHSQIFQEFVGLRAKMYCFQVYQATKAECKAKGLVKTIRRTLP